MAVVRNKTGDELSLQIPGSPSVRPGKEIDVPDADFAGRAWPKSVWQIARKPSAKKFTDASVDDAYIFLPADAAEDAPTADDVEETN